MEEKRGEGILQNKRVCITGGTSGIGKALAFRCAREGAQLFIISRKKSKAQNMEQELREELIKEGKSYSPPLFFQTDLSLMENQKTAVQWMKSKIDSLHILVNNCGAYFAKKEITSEGLERTFALNHMSYFVLTLLLLPLLKKAAPARILNVSSKLHKRGNLDLKAVAKGENPAGLQGYADSKLANLLFTFYLAPKLPSSLITVNSLHPGFVATSLGTNNGLLYSLAMKLARPFQISPQNAAEHIFYLLSASELQKKTGSYFYEKQEVQPSPLARNRKLQEELFKLSLHLSRLPSPFPLN